MPKAALFLTCAIRSAFTRWSATRSTANASRVSSQGGAGSAAPCKGRRKSSSATADADRGPADAGHDSRLLRSLSPSRCRATFTEPGSSAPSSPSAVATARRSGSAPSISDAVRRSAPNASATSGATPPDPGAPPARPASSPCRDASVSASASAAATLTAGVSASTRGANLASSLLSGGGARSRLTPSGSLGTALRATCNASRLSTRSHWRRSLARRARALATPGFVDGVAATTMDATCALRASSGRRFA